MSRKEIKKEGKKERKKEEKKKLDQKRITTSTGRFYWIFPCVRRRYSARAASTNCNQKWTKYPSKIYSNETQKLDQKWT